MNKSPDPKKETFNSRPDFLLKELLALAPKADIIDSQLIILTILAGLVALIGLFLNSPAVIIGAMVISPLLEPIYAGTVFLANGSMKKFLQHVKVLGVLLVTLIIVSALFTACLTVFTTLPITPEILSRLEQKEISAILAVLLGITAIVAHKRSFITAVIGVGISVALVPPAVVTGITMVLLPDRIIDALSLTLNNVFGLFVGMLIAILVLGVGPLGKAKLNLARKCMYMMTVFIAIMLLVIFLILTLTHHNY